MRTLFAFMLLGAAFHSAMADEDWGHDYDALIAQPGTKVTYGSVNQGDPTREIRLSNGVAYMQVRHDGKLAYVLESDFSGHGAVACVYSIYLAVDAVGAVCNPSQNGASGLGAQLARIERFIVANEPQRGAMSGEAVAQARIAAFKAQAAATAPAAEAKAAFCQGPQAKFLLGIAAQTDAAILKANVDNLLSVPRPAVMNPCL
jgi:hypothetical protein